MTNETDERDLWYIGIKRGVYTTKQMLKMAKIKVSYACVYQTLMRLGVENHGAPEQKDHNVRNTKVWFWSGDDYYLSKRGKR